MHRVELFRAPVDPAGFDAFCKASLTAGQAVYDRLIGYKHGPRFGGGPYNYTNDFAGLWLASFRIREWVDDKNMPMNLSEALSRV